MGEFVKNPRHAKHLSAQTIVCAIHSEPLRSGLCDRPIYIVEVAKRMAEKPSTHGARKHLSFAPLLGVTRDRKCRRSTNDLPYLGS